MDRIQREIAVVAAVLRLTDTDFQLARSILAGRLHDPDFIIAPDGEPYLFRWYLVPDGASCDARAVRHEMRGLVMLHLQVASDPERPFHDHPWDNQSVILAGEYEEHIQPDPPYGSTYVVRRKQGDVIWRRAAEAHRLILPEGVPYAMTLFSTGPQIKDWGFWYGDEWHHSERHAETRDGASVHINREE